MAENTQYFQREVPWEVPIGDLPTDVASAVGKSSIADRVLAVRADDVPGQQGVAAILRYLT